MKYKVRKNYRPGGIKNFIKYYFSDEKRHLKNYRLEKKEDDIRTHSRIVINGDFKKLLVIKKYYDYIERIRIFRETEYLNREILRDSIVRKDEENKTLEFYNRNEKGSYDYFKRSYEKSQNPILRDENIIYTALHFLDWKEKIEEIEKEETEKRNRELPKLQRVKRLK